MVYKELKLTSICICGQPYGKHDAILSRCPEVLENTGKIIPGKFKKETFEMDKTK